MKLSISLKKQLVDFINVYEKWFSKTILSAIILTAFCFVIATCIASFDSFTIELTRPTSILSYFTQRFSYHDTYNIVDLVKTVYIFLVSLFSINLIRNKQNPNQSDGLTYKLKAKDLIYLFLIFIVCVLLDCALFRLDGQLQSMVDNKDLMRWFHDIIYLMRIFSPLVLFPVIIQILLSKSLFFSREILFLIISVWIFNEISYEFSVLIRMSVFNLLLSPFHDIQVRYWVESVLAIPLMALYFLGFFSAMTSPFTLSQEV